MQKIQDLSKKIDISSLIYHYKSKTGAKSFLSFKGPLNYYKT